MAQLRSRERYSKEQVDQMALEVLDRCIALLDAKNASDPGWQEREKALQAAKEKKPTNMSGVFARGLAHIEGLGL